MINFILGLMVGGIVGFWAFCVLGSGGSGEKGER